LLQIIREDTNRWRQQRDIGWD